jgi:hypothetical protein
MQHNKAVETDAQVRTLPSVAPILVRRSPLRYVSPEPLLDNYTP